MEQMKKSACKIYINEVFKGTGFFCKIPLGNNNLLQVLCTSSYINSESILKTENKISISQNNKFKRIDKRIKYTNEKLGMTFLELKENDELNNYLKLDDNIEGKENILYIKKTVYILHFSRNKNIELSYGIIKEEENKYNFNHILVKVQ